MKRIVSLVLAVSMVLSMFTFSFAGTSVTDVAGTEYEAAVEALIELGVVEGYPDKTYQPAKTVSRAEMAKMLVVAAGLNDAAEIAKGATRFSDVNGNHWASGYINVAAEYGYIAGYPDGTFQPDVQVSYAEATTMALRVLGYKTVVESKGTWPTNYIAKAHDLELLDEITYGTYNDGAVRGNVAKLIWNTLRTEMWAVTGESEGDGLISEKDRVMLNVKFPDYSYGKVKFESFEISDNGEVVITLNSLENGEDKDGNPTLLDYPLEGIEYEYLGNDFYTFVPTQEVEVLVNEKDETLLTMVSTGVDKVVEGLKADLNEDYEKSDNLVANDYAYALVKSRKMVSLTDLKVDSEYIYEVDEAKNGKSVRLNKMQKMTYEDFDDEEIVIIDGQRGSIKDVKVGDVLSKVSLAKADEDGKVEHDASTTFYIVKSSTVEGKLTKLVNDEKAEITVAGEKYPVDAKAKYVVDPEDEDEDQTKGLLDTDSATTKDREDMKNEEVIMYLDFLGRVVRVEFDGNIDGEDDSEWKFFTVAEVTEKESSRKYSVVLANEDGEETYSFAKADEGKKWYAGEESKNHEIGDFVLVEFDDDGEILSMHTIAKATGEKKYSYTPSGDGTYVYGDASKDEVYITVKTENASYDDEKEEIVNGSKKYVVDVDDGTVVVFLVWDNKGTDTSKDDEVVVSFEEGLDALDDLKNEDVVVVYDNSNKIKTAKYIVRFDDASTRVDDLAGKLTEVSKNLVDGKYREIVVNDDEDEALYVEEELDSLKGFEYGVIVYSTKTNKDGEEIAEITSKVKFDTFKKLSAKTAVEEVLSTKIKFDCSGETYTLDQIVDEEFEDYLFVVVDVDVDAENEDVVDSVTVVPAEELTLSTFKVDDRLHDDDENNVLYIVRGYDEKPLSLNKEALSLIIGAEETLKATVLNVEESDEEPSVNWLSSDDDIAFVEDGKVTARSSGTATITATATINEIEYKVTCTVTVPEVTVEIEGDEKVTLILRDEEKSKITLKAIVTNAKDEGVTWKSENTDIVTIDAETGKVEAMAKTADGETVTITATSKVDETKTATCEVEVLDV